MSRRRIPRPTPEAALAALDEETRTKLLAYRPASLPDEQFRVLDEVLHDVCGWVAMARPQSAGVACYLARFNVPLAAWTYIATGECSPETVYDPRHVEFWAMAKNSHRSSPWRQTARSAARRVGRAVYPAGWPPAPIKSAHRPAVPAYTRAEEGMFLLAARLIGRKNRTRRMALAPLALGAGLNGVEIAQVEPGDLVKMGGGRLAVEVSGRNPRIVPVRVDYTETLLEAAEEAAGQARFFSGRHKNSVHYIAEELTVEGLGALSILRSRSTWLTAHLVAGTPLGALRKCAGPLSVRTLDSLVDAVSQPLTPEEAARQGLGA